MIKNNKRGFNLIEIAIVLAVIGLVIGGIYVAASAVTENNRKQNTQKQLLQIVQNTRAIFATQTTFVAPTYAQIKAMNIFPGDLQDSGSTFLNSYGGATDLTAGSTNQQFQVRMAGLSQGACIDLLTKGFGGTQNVNQIGLVDAGTAAAMIGASGVSDGISVGEATTACSNPSNANTAQFVFNLRG